MNHTKGPWIVEPRWNTDSNDNSRSVGSIYSESLERFLATMEDPCSDSDEEQMANAHLMAAAPDLLEALKRRISGDVRSGVVSACHPSLQFCEVCGHNSERFVHSENCPVLFAELAIAKAEGRS